MDYASINRHVHVLDWWKRSDLQLEYPGRAMDYTSMYGHPNVLTWWKASGLKLKYSYIAIDGALYKNNVDCLDWWKSSKLELKYNSDNRTLLQPADSHIEAKAWWDKYGHELRNISHSS